MQGALPQLQALIKAFCAEVMQLLLQVCATFTTLVCAAEYTLVLLMYCCSPLLMCSWLMMTFGYV